MNPEDRRTLYTQLCVRIADLNKREETLWTIFLSFFGGGLILAALNGLINQLTSNPLIGVLGISVSVAFATANLRVMIKISSLTDKAELVEGEMQIPAQQGLYRDHPPAFIFSFLVWCILYPVPLFLSVLLFLGYVPSREILVRYLEGSPIVFIIIFAGGLAIRSVYRHYFKPHRTQGAAPQDQAEERGEPNAPSPAASLRNKAT